MSDTATTYPLYLKDDTGKCYMKQVSEQLAMFVIFEKNELILNIAHHANVINEVKRLYAVYKLSSMDECSSLFDKTTEQIKNMMNLSHT